ncbi:hypothetical protein SJC03_42 [Bacteroides phage SJC03]|nr:hypothetical protein SJC03_42 [Bacteroides phage SJC03]
MKIQPIRFWHYRNKSGSFSNGCLLDRWAINILPKIEFDSSPFFSSITLRISFINILLYFNFCWDDGKVIKEGATYSPNIIYKNDNFKICLDKCIFNIFPTISIIQDPNNFKIYISIEFLYFNLHFKF